MSRLARFRFRLSADISYRCRGREGRKSVSLGIRGTSLTLKYRCRTLRIDVCIPSCLLFPYSLSRNDNCDQLECYVWTRFAIMCQLHTRAVHCYVIAISQLFRATPCVCVYAFTSIVLLEILLFRISRSR